MGIEHGSFVGSLQQANPLGMWLGEKVPFLRKIDPSLEAGKDWKNRNTGTFAPGAYSGVTPTLADANAGYQGRPAGQTNFTPGGYGASAPKAAAPFALPGAQPQQSQQPGTAMAAPRRVPSSFTPNSWG